MRTSKWKATCATAATISSSASTPIPTSTSQRPSTTSTYPTGRLIGANGCERIRFLVISFKSDWLYPPYQSQEIVKELKRKACDVTYCEIASTYGHDAFLLEVKEQTNLIRPFLDKTFHGYEVAEYAI